jgi:hypothetical protein
VPYTSRTINSILSFEIDKTAVQKSVITATLTRTENENTPSDLSEPIQSADASNKIDILND